MQVTSDLIEWAGNTKGFVMAKKSIGDRIAEVRRRKGWSQSQLSEKCGWGSGQSRVSNYEQNRSTPSLEDIGKLARVLGVNSAFLAFGDISERDPGYEDGSIPTFGDDDIYTIPPLPGSATYGNLKLEKSLLDKVGIKNDAGRWFILRDNSMEPVIPTESAVAVDTQDRSIISGMRYAVLHGGILTVRMVYQLPKGAFRLKSYNREEWPDEIVDAADADDLEIIGRVAWYCVMA